MVLGNLVTMEELVTLKLSTYDQLQMELINLQDEVKRLKDTINDNQVFRLESSGYNNMYRLKFTESAKEYLEKLKLANPELNYLKDLPDLVEWDFAKTKEVEEDA